MSKNNFYDKFLSEVDFYSKNRFRNTTEKLLRKKISSVNKLVKEYPNLSKGEKFVAMCIFGDYKIVKSIPILFKEVITRKGELMGLAGAAISKIGGKNNYHKLKELYFKEDPGINRHSILFSISMIEGLDDYEEVAYFLFNILKDDSIDNELRVIAAGGLQDTLDRCDKRKRVYRQAVDMLLELTYSPITDLSYYSAHVLGQLCIYKAIPRLEEMGLLYKTWSEPGKYIKYKIKKGINMSVKRFEKSQYKEFEKDNRVEDFEKVSV